MFCQRKKQKPVWNLSKNELKVRLYLNRELTGSGPKLDREEWKSLESQQGKDTYWMDIIEVVGFSIIGKR